METDKLIKAAIAWAEQGVPVFPCGPDKAPLTVNGHKDASLDPAQIKFMFQDCPEGTMIGARMGKDSGLFACDFDLYKPGAEDYMRSLIDKGLLNETQTHLTVSGGIHFIYRSAIQPNVKPSFGVEVKGEGGYVIVPPSQGYSIEREGINNANPELVKELLRAQKVSSTTSVDRLKRQVLSGKSFHDPLAQIAARRSAQGWTIERVQKELLDTLAASAASSPSHPRHERWQALIEDRGEELSRIVGTGNDKFNSSAKTERVKEKVDFDLARNLDRGSSSFFGKERLDNNNEDKDQDSETNSEEPEAIEAWPFNQSGYFSQEERNIRDQRYVAYPFVSERETMLIAAEPKVGKTAIALTLAYAISIGESLTDAIAITEPRPVLYFTLEGARAVELRLAAIKKDRHDRELPAPERDMLFVVDRPHNFLSPDYQEQNCARIALHAAKCQQEFGSDLGWIVIDTLTKAMPGGDQNSVEDTSQLFEMIGMLRDFGVTANIAFIHHLSKQGNVRGSTNIEAEVDVVLGVEKVKDSNDVWLNIRRARSMDEDTSYRFSFRSVYLGETVQGHKLHAPVVELVGNERPTGGDTARENVKWQKINNALIELGAGTHNVVEIVSVLGEWVEPPTGKRPNYFAKAIQKPLRSLFEGRHTWAYGDWHMSLGRNQEGDIIEIEMRYTK